MSFAWPRDFPRIPEDEWVHRPSDELARKYDTVESHGWYANLEPTVDVLAEELKEGQLLIDYSAGTGIFVDRLRRRVGALACGFLLVDASPKFLRVALDRLGADERVAFRWIRYKKPERRLQMLDEVLSASLLSRGADLLCSTNAIHLYYDLPETLASWYRMLRPGAGVYVQSGNIDNPVAPAGTWIIDDTVEKLQPLARRLVCEETRFAAFREALEDAEGMKAHEALRRKYFLPVRPLRAYTDALAQAGFDVVQARAHTIRADVGEWVEFLSAYHDGVLGWAGGTQKVNGRTPNAVTVGLRLCLLRESMVALFEDEGSFDAVWTYIDCRKPGRSA